jgi:hypothetical protein
MLLRERIGHFGQGYSILPVNGGRQDSVAMLAPNFSRRSLVFWWERNRDECDGKKLQPIANGVSVA